MKEDTIFGQLGRIRSSKTNKASRAAVIAAIAVGGTVAVQSTSVVAQTRALEEILVTSRRFEESITDAPLAVAVMSDEYLRENRVDSIQDILELTPGADWGQFAKAQPGLSLRGIPGASYGNASLEHSVSVVYDGVPATKAFMMTLPVYDLQRVEVLRGPQGTTFGRNATLGMMHFISARPSQDQSGSIELSTGERGYAGLNGYLNGAITDTLSARLAVNYGDVPGSMDDAATGDPLEDAETSSIRASFLWEPTDTFSAYLKAEAVQDQEFPTVRRGTDTTGLPWLNANYGNYASPTDPWEADLSPAADDAPWQVTRDMRFLTAELTWDLDNDMTITSITGYQSGNHYSLSDAFGTPFDIRDQEVWDDANVFTQEVRLDNQASGNQLRWLVGASLVDDEQSRVERNESEPLRDNCNAVDPSGCPRNSTLFTEAYNTTDSYGIFGEITYDISDELTLAVGGRYSSDERSLDFATYGYGAAGGLGGIGLGNPNTAQDCAVVVLTTPGFCGTEANPVGFADTVSDSWSDFSSKVSLTYAVNENNNVYALYSEGFKAGGFQQDSRTASNLGVILDAEGAQNIEFGWKGSYDTLVFAITAFIQEQTDVQTGNLVVVGSSQANLLVNAAGIDNTGLEIEATWAATDNLTIGGSIASYSPEFKSGSAIASTFDAATGSFSGGEDVSGTVPAGSVEEASYLFATYEWSLSDGSSLSLRGDWRHRGEVWGQNGAVSRQGLDLSGENLAYLRPSLDKLGLRLGWTSPDENWGWSLWGRNLDNDPDYINYGPGFGYVYNNGASVDGSTVVRSRAVGTTGRRQIGATLNYSF